MTTPNPPDNITIPRELLRLWEPIAEVLLKDPHNDKMRMAFRKALDHVLDAPAVEPDAFLHDDGYWTAAKTDAGRALNDRLHFAGSTKVAVYTAPQAQQEKS